MDLISIASALFTACQSKRSLSRGIDCFALNTKSFVGCIGLIDFADILLFPRLSQVESNSISFTSKWALDIDFLVKLLCSEIHSKDPISYILLAELDGLKGHRIL